ncbi:MAG: AAA family ATPase [Muribaculaceae bacterium]|nr:AAA family ATPase [Muribaculaceae bacterium]
MAAENPEHIDLDNREFQKVWELVTHTNRSIFLTGKAGAGKSTFLRHITSNTKKKHVILAPTGIAAVNAGGVTLHSFFKLPFKPVLPDDPDFNVRYLRERMKYSSNFVKLLRELELIVIDEISMVRADTIDFIDKLLRLYTGRRMEPFGGKQMLFVGDLFQLEPVVPGETRDILRKHYDNFFFFSANVFKEFSVIPIELKKIYRQTDPTFISLLDRVRSGSPTEDDIRLLNSHLKPDVRSEQNNFIMTLATHRDMVDAINDHHLNLLKSPVVTYTGEISGEFPETALPTPMELQLKVGAQVVFIKNDFDHRWVNGTIGKVYSAQPGGLEIELESGERYVVELERWANIRYDYDEDTKKISEVELGSYTQYPLRLAWALTIHKSQGLTFNNVIIDMGRGAFSGGQTYVALSRCRSLEGLTLRSTVNMRDMFVNPAIVNFSRNFNSDTLFESALEDAHTRELFHRAAESWNNGEIGLAVDQLTEASAKDYRLDKPLIKRYLKQKLSVIKSQKAEIESLRHKVSELEETLRKLAEEYVELGHVCMKSNNDPEPALRNFNKALSISPDCVDAMIAKARLLMSIGEHDAACTVAENAVKTEPENYDALTLSGELSLATDSLFIALDRLLTAIKVREDDPRAYELVSEVYKAVGETDEAKKYRKIAMKLRRKK